MDVAYVLNTSNDWWLKLISEFPTIRGHKMTPSSRALVTAMNECYWPPITPVITRKKGP